MLFLKGLQKPLNVSVYENCLALLLIIIIIFPRPAMPVHVLVYTYKYLVGQFHGNLKRTTAMKKVIHAGELGKMNLTTSVSS